MQKMIKVLFSIMLLSIASGNFCMWKKVSEPFQKASSYVETSCREWFIHALKPHFRDMKVVDGVKCGLLFFREQFNAISPRDKKRLIMVGAAFPYVLISFVALRQSRFQHECHMSSLSDLMNRLLPKFFKRSNDTLRIMVKIVDRKVKMGEAEQERCIETMASVEDLIVNHGKDMSNWKNCLGQPDATILKQLDELIQRQQESLKHLSEVVQLLK